MKPTTYIYELIDPITNTPRYVGKSDSPRPRFARHKWENINKPKTHKECWIRSLRDKGLCPILSIITICAQSQWVELECYYIKLYNELGYNLTNLTSGGENPPRHFGPRSKSWCKNISRALKGHVVTAEAIEKMKNTKKQNPVRYWKGKKFSTQHCIRISNTKRTKPKSEAQLLQKTKLWVPIVQLDMQGQFIKEWVSQKEATVALSLSKSGVNHCLKGRNRSCDGFLWEYKEQYDFYSNK